MDRINSELLILRAKRVVFLASLQQQTLCFAESCTGGLLSAVITEIPGVSSIFNGSVVSYSNRVKNNILGVAEDILLKKGAVSRECSIQMAVGARYALKSNYALSITGIAGPDGGSEKKPVGTVWIGISSSTGVQDAYHFYFSHQARTEVRFFAVLAAYALLESALASNG